jgi:hypothetical protein
MDTISSDIGSTRKSGHPFLVSQSHQFDYSRHQLTTVKHVLMLKYLQKLCENIAVFGYGHERTITSDLPMQSIQVLSQVVIRSSWGGIPQHPAIPPT